MPTAAVAASSTNADDAGKNVMNTEAERTAMKATVLEVVINLTNKGLLGARETNMANDMVLRENPVLVAAFKVRMSEGLSFLQAGTIAAFFCTRVR